MKLELKLYENKDIEKFSYIGNIEILDLRDIYNFIKRKIKREEEKNEN